MPGKKSEENLRAFMPRKLTEDEMPPDYFALLSLMFGVVGMMMKVIE